MCPFCFELHFKNNTVDVAAESENTDLHLNSVCNIFNLGHNIIAVMQLYCMENLWPTLVNI